MEHAAPTAHHLALNVSQVTEPQKIEDTLAGDFAEEWRQNTSHLRTTRHGTL